MNELKDMYNVQCKLYLIDIHVFEFCKLNLMFNIFLKSDIVSLNIAIVIRFILCTKIKHWDMKMGVKQKIK